MPLYIAQSGDLEGCHACLTHWLTVHWLTTLRDRATQLLIKFKTGALVTQFDIDFHLFLWFFLRQNVTSSEAQYLNVGGTMSQSQGTSHPSRWKLEWIWFPQDVNFNALNMISHMRWNIMENPNDYVLQVFSHSSCYIFKISPVVKLWHTLSLYMFQDRDFTWWWFWWTYWWWWWWLAITKPGTMMAVMLTRETGQRFVVQYRLCVDSL